MPAPPATDQSDLPDDQVVIGVDTHKDIHVVVALTTTGRMLGSSSFRTTTAGYRDLLAWAQRFGAAVVAGVEGTGSWGAALARFLRSEGVKVIEVNRPDRSMVDAAARPTRSTPKRQPGR
jgi:transposase